MELEQLQESIISITGRETVPTYIDRFKLENGLTDADIEEYKKEFNPEEHKVFDEAFRPRNAIKDEAGKTTYVDVNRIALNLQQVIVARHVAFLLGNPVELLYTANDAEEKYADLIKKIWKDNKLDYKGKDICKRQKSETRVAEIWYADTSKPDYWKGTIASSAKTSLRVRVVSPLLGDKLYPLFNAMGDMIALGREYDLLNSRNRMETVFDLYTDTDVYEFRPTVGYTWIMNKKPHGFSKMPVIYYSQLKPDWSNVQWMIERLETLLSNHADSNDRIAFPVVLIKGVPKAFGKTTLGQVRAVKLEKDAEMSYLESDGANSSLELEYKTLRSFIFDLTNTPDISIEQLKGVGDFSGIALKMLFLNAHLQAAEDEEIFGVNMQRRINFLKRALSDIAPALKVYEDFEITPGFKYYLPKNEVEEMNLAVTAYTAKISSLETAVKENPLTQNATEEIKKIEDAEKKRTEGDINNEFN